MRRALPVVLALVLCWTRCALAHAHKHVAEHEADGSAESDPTLPRFKIFCLLLIFGSAMLGGYMAIYLKTFEHRDRLMELGNSMAGGVFLAAGLLHMLPEAEQELRDSFVAPSFPLGSLLCLIGMLLPLYIERVLFDDVPRSDGFGESGGELQGQVVSTLGPAQHQHSHQHSHHAPLLRVAADGGMALDAPTEAGPGAPGAPKNILLPYMMALLLSIHSLIEGVALGAEDTRSAATMIFVAIIAHKSLAAFSLGVTLTRADMPTQRFTHVMTLFSLMTPLGGLVGLMASASVTGAFQSLLSAVVTCVAAGTFVYVGLVEILLVEFEHGAQGKQTKFAFVIGGALLMAMMGLLL